MNQRKKTTTLSINEKNEIIEFVEKNTDVSHTRVAEIFSNKFKKTIGRRSILNYAKNKSKIATTLTTNSLLTNCSREMKFSGIDDRLSEWLDMVETQGGCYNEAIIKEKAMQIAEKLQLDEFKASNGWLFKFKARHKIGEKYLSGESFNFKKDDFEGFYTEIRLKMSIYEDKNIYNCDETALFYKMIPSKSLVMKARNGIKANKDRLSIMFCVNKDGSDKLKPLIIGKSKNPRALKNFSYNSLCDYSNNDSAWMTTVIFNQWLMNIDKKMKAEKRKILMLFDNCPSHKITYNADNIEIVYLPKNSTAITQPLDSGIIRSFKSKFYHYILSKIVSKISETRSAYELYKELTIKDAILYTNWAWKDVTAEVIKRCWIHAGYYNSLETNELNNVKLNSSKTIESTNTEFDMIMEHLKIIDPVSEDALLDLEINENELYLDRIDKEFQKRDLLKTDEHLLAKENINGEPFNLEDGSWSAEENNSIEIMNVDKAIECFDYVKEFLISELGLSFKDFEGLKNIEKAIYAMKRKKQYPKIIDYFCLKKNE